MRKESDSMGDVHIDDRMYWGAQTQRACENFTVSDYKVHPAMIWALGIIKKSAAVVNQRLGLLEKKRADAISQAADKMIHGELTHMFPVDVFQTGSGTSWNMNANEVIANLANESLGGKPGDKAPVHPNDHVNMGQSSNDVIPSAINLANLKLLMPLCDVIDECTAILRTREEEFAGLIKLGRTHLQDAVPMTVSQELSAWRYALETERNSIIDLHTLLGQIPMGGTAIGTGLNTHADFSRLICDKIHELSGFEIVPCRNLFEGIAARRPQLQLMNAMNSLAVSLMKIGQDLRFLSSGPRGGLGEYVLPALQPGSSIMPSKVNPVIPEMLIQVCAHVMGKHSSVTIACQNAPLQLNIMMPLIAFETTVSQQLMTAAVRNLTDKCLSGLKVDKKRCEHWIAWSLALVTPLAKKIGYDKASKLAYKAFRENRKVKKMVIEEGVLSQAEADALFDPSNMV